MGKFTPVNADVIIIGAGAAGLEAARALARRGRAVVIVEARARTGGRVHTVRKKGWWAPIELGPEFVHGGNRLLWNLLKRAHVSPRHTTRRHWLGRVGGVKLVDDLSERIGAVTQMINPRPKKPQTFQEFLRGAEKKISAEDYALAANFVEGFEAAPLDRMSAQALAGESLDESEQYIVPGGYDNVLKFLAGEAATAGARVALGRVVERVRWKKNSVEVSARNTRGKLETYGAKSLIVTVPLGVLQSKASEAGHIEFIPRLAGKEKIIAGMGMGHVVRMVCRFERRSWRKLLEKPMGKIRGPFGFIHSRVAGIPVWWSLAQEGIVTAWAGGPAAIALMKLKEGAILQTGLRSLAHMLCCSPAELRSALRDWTMHDWNTDPFSRGAYSYTAVGAENAPRELARPVRDTIFFAGEATADAEETGTVHGALTSGHRAAEEILNIGI